MTKPLKYAPTKDIVAKQLLSNQDIGLPLIKSIIEFLKLDIVCGKVRSITTDKDFIFKIWNCKADVCYEVNNALSVAIEVQLKNNHDYEERVTNYLTLMHTRINENLKIKEIRRYIYRQI